MVTRVGGLASGMDIDGLVEKLMSAERTPYNKLTQTKQKYEWQRDAYRDVNTKVKAFDDFLFNDMTLQKDFYKKTVVSTNSAVSAVATTADNGQSLTIGSVTQLARSGNAKTSGVIAKGTEGTKTLAELNVLSSGSTQEVSMKVLQKDGTMKDVKVEFSSDDTLDSVISKLKKDTGLNAFYDKQSGQISISTQATGVADSYPITLNGEDENHNPIEVIRQTTASVYVESGSNFFTSLGFENGKSLITNGQNAKVTINGAEIERKSNTFNIDGFDITLNNTYNGDVGQPIDLTTKVDTDNMVDKIKKFVETYNGLIESLNGLTKEARFRDYAPLTEEQKKDMDEKEIESWEKQSKSGILRGDSILNSVLNNMRTTMYSSGGGKQDIRATATDPSQNFINSLYEMGITTSSKTSDRGKLEINETKLREAIEKDPEQVFKTFTDNTKGNEGIVQKLRSNLQATTRDIEKKAGKLDSVNATFTLGRYLNDTEDRIDNWKSKLANIEARYWKQFGAMESAINKANQQSSSLFAGQTQ